MDVLQFAVPQPKTQEQVREPEDRECSPAAHATNERAEHDDARRRPVGQTLRCHGRTTKARHRAANSTKKRCERKYRHKRNCRTPLPNGERMGTDKCPSDAANDRAGCKKGEPAGRTDADEREEVATPSADRRMINDRRTMRTKNVFGGLRGGITFSPQRVSRGKFMPRLQDCARRRWGANFSLPVC